MIEKIYELLTRAGITRGQDKVLHFIAGLGLGVAGQVLFPDSILMIVPILGIAIGKELYDEFVKDTYFDFFDMFATLLGGAVGIMAYGLILG